MDVRIGGVVVGSIASIDLTDDKKAAVVLKIENSDYQDFRKDAFCTIRPQSLIGERFIECEPTQPKPTGAQQPPLLAEVQSGPGSGQYLLPATNTARSVDLDLINNIMRLPFRQRFTIFLNEFGTGLAGNGRALSDALHKSNPALREFDNVLKILADQNRTLAALAVNGDTALEPLAREREHIKGFINASAKTASATADAQRGARGELPPAAAVPARARADDEQPRRLLVRAAPDRRGARRRRRPTSTRS